MTGGVSPMEVNLINDNLKIFTQTSDKPYDQNKYKIILKNGKSVVVEDYETMKSMWYQWRKDVSNVEVILINKPKKKRGEGF